MPTVRLTVVEGHTPEQLRRFMDGVTRLAIETLGAQEEGVIVHVEELRGELYMRGGKSVAERRRAA
jgi:4-oxalocrotonate tautomerase family enzyme